MERWFFHFFWIFLGRNPPCCDVRLVGVGRGGALHVSCIFSEIFCINCSNFVHVVCHWLFVSWLFRSVLVISFIWSVFSSKNSIWKFSMFSCGMGFKILSALLVVGGVWRASRMFGGMCSVTGEWSEFRLCSLFVVDVYRELLGVLI